MGVCKNTLLTNFNRLLPKKKKNTNQNMKRCKKPELSFPDIWVSNARFTQKVFCLPPQMVGVKQNYIRSHRLWLAGFADLRWTEFISGQRVRCVLLRLPFFRPFCIAPPKTRFHLPVLDFLGGEGGKVVAKSLIRPSVAELHVDLCFPTRKSMR